MQDLQKIATQIEELEKRSAELQKGYDDHGDADNHGDTMLDDYEDLQIPDDDDANDDHGEIQEDEKHSHPDHDPEQDSTKGHSSQVHADELGDTRGQEDVAEPDFAPHKETHGVYSDETLNDVTVKDSKDEL